MVLNNILLVAQALKDLCFTLNAFNRALIRGVNDLNMFQFHVRIPSKQGVFL